MTCFPLWLMGNTELALISCKYFHRHWLRGYLTPNGKGKRGLGSRIDMQYPFWYQMGGKPNSIRYYSGVIVVQQVEPPLGTPASHISIQGWVRLCFCSSFLLVSTIQQLLVALVLEFLPRTWETWTELLASTWFSTSSCGHLRNASAGGRALCGCHFAFQTKHGEFFSRH